MKGGLWRNSTVYTIKGLTEADVVFRFAAGREAVRRFWEEEGHDFAVGGAHAYSEKNRLSFGFLPNDDEQIREAVRLPSGNFPGGFLERRVGWSWLVEREGQGWVVVAERAPGQVGRRLPGRDAVSFGEPGGAG